MTLSIPPGFGHVIHSVKLASDPEPMAVTFGFGLNNTVDTPAEADAVCNACAVIFHDDVMPHMSTQYSLIQTEMQYRYVGDTLATPIRVSVSALSGAGASTDAPAPQNCAILVQKRTGVGGRRGRGRLYLQSPLEASVDANGTLVSSYHSALQTMANTWLSDLAGIADGLGGMHLLHSTTLAIPDPVDLPVPYQVTTLVVDPIIATQRRRLRR